MMPEDLEIKIAQKSAGNSILLICLGLILITAIAYEPVRHNDFVKYDDYKYLVRNHHVQDGITNDSIVWAFTSFHASNWHPLTWISHMIDCGIFGLNPLWHHLVNVLFHICSTLLLFVILRRTTAALWPSALVAALFAVHPAHVESVAWAAERKDVLSTFFWLLTMLGYVDYVKKPGLSRYIITLVVFCLGLMAKPMLVTLPFILLLFDFWPLGRFRFASDERINGDGYERQSFWKLILEKIPFFAVAACSAGVTILAQQKAMGMADVDVFDFLTRISNALVSYVAYMGKMVCPKDLAVLYPLQIEGLGYWKPLFAAVILLLITSVVLYAGRKKGYLLVGWLWYLITLLPVIGLVQVGAQAMADRYTYVPSIGFFIMLVWMAGDLVRKIHLPKLVSAVVCSAVIVTLIICTRLQVGYWQNSLTLFGRAIEVTENNYVMHNNYAAVLVNHGRYDEALQHFQRVLKINPKYIRAKANIGYVLTRKKKFDEAIEYFNDALSVNQNWPYVHNQLGMVYACKKEYQTAIECYKRAVELEPDNADAYNNWALALKSLGRTDEAQVKFDKAEQLLQDKKSGEETIFLTEQDNIGEVRIDGE